MIAYLLNPTISRQPKYIREGRCMQKAASWATVWPPITMAVMGAMARKYSDVRLIDGNVEEWTLDALADEVRQRQPDVIAVNTGFPSIDADMAVAKALKMASPKTLIVGFGAYFTLLEQEAMTGFPFLDAGIVGEPEETFEELVAARARGADTFDGIRGLVLRRNGDVISTGIRPLIDDIDTLPFPDRSLLANDRYRLPHNNRPFTLVNTSRGCPYPCTFCIVKPYYGNRVRRHSAGYILREIQECVERYGIDEFLFWEEVFTLDKGFVLEFCRELRDRGLRIRWAATTRVTAVEEETLRAMKEAGCYLLGLGVESSSQEILDRAKKKQTVADVERAVALCRKVGVATMGHCIFGLPGETLETAEATIRFMTRLGLDYMQSYCAVPYPKTELGELARDKGWITARTWSQYDFGGDSVMDTDTNRGEEVTEFRRRAFRRFYLRPVYLVKTALRSFSLQQVISLLRFRDWMRPGSGWRRR
jgi:anaerobic magnesium-protoporphyrin IX monomethyl ester cyclase